MTTRTSKYNTAKKWNNTQKPFSMRKWENKPNYHPRRYGRTFVFYICEVCKIEFTDRFCPKCGLEAKDFKRFHPI